MNEPVHHDEHPHVVSRNARYGLTLFAIYVALYAGFIFLAVFRTDSLGKSVLMGVNLAVVYGFGLIIAAIVLALVYMLLTRRPAKHSLDTEGDA